MDPLDDHFEDFTTASEWENFIARLEQLLSECAVTPADSSNITNNWFAIHDRISFSDYPFKFSYFKRLNLDVEGSSDVLITSSKQSRALNEGDEIQLPEYLLSSIANTEPEFPPKYVPHVVAEYFNLLEFVILSPAAIEPIEKESKLKILLSSSCIALNNTSSSFPVFVQFHHWSQKYFCGIAESFGVRTSYQMIMLQSNPNLPSHLSGLLDLFKSKIGLNLPFPVEISAHFFYKLKSWTPDVNCDSYPPELFEMLQNCASEYKTGESNSNKINGHTCFLPFGSLDDPFVSMDLVAGWPLLTEDVVVDSPSYSDLEPENAQEWFLSLKADGNAEYRLNELVEKMCKLKNDSRTTEQVLGKPIESILDAQKFSSALEKITRNQVTIPTINQVLDNARRQAFYSSDPNAYEDLAPISKLQMDLLLDFLFPDAKKQPAFPYTESFQDCIKFKRESTNNIMDNLIGVKSAPIGSIVWRLSVIAAYLLAYGDQGSPSVVAHLWAEVILELRYRLDHSKTICGLEAGMPNIGTCLLNQKLQMLNCCIEKKISRENKQRESENTGSSNAIEAEAEESDEEFFDCEDNMMDENVVQKINKPSGRLRKNGKMKLLKTGEFMYIPETQDPAPLTEDVMEEQSKILIQLGNDAEGSELRAKMMSASLLSDMESFKAANPGAELEDFVRWYSPRDWVESNGMDQFGNPVGELSPRMKLAGNLWIETWKTAMCVPARRQKRLFDDTKEAEKVLHWLSTRTLSDVSQLLLPCLVHAAAVKIISEVDTLPFDYVPVGLTQSVVQLTRCFRCVAQIDKSSEDFSMHKNLLMKNLLKYEKDITQIRSFQLKFPTENTAEILNRNSEAKISSDIFPTFIKVANGKKSELGERIYELFVNSASEFDTSTEIESERNVSKFGYPFRKVFVLKYLPQYGASSNTTHLPQRMSCLLKGDMFVIAGTFSTKTGIN